MLDFATNISTRGITSSNGSDITTFSYTFTVLSIEYETIIPKSGSSHAPVQKTKKMIKITYAFNDTIYVDRKIVNSNVNVSMNNIQVDVKNSKPSIKLIFDENI